ncbi:MAG: heavy metal-binding domain-containing protein [Robiginitomaculum sp.]|nr:heavy metal-binding domain-containing protein [Robiginitomaculum sp.]
MTALGVFAVLLVIGFVFGRINEAAHFVDLNRREARLSHMVLSSSKQVPSGAMDTSFVSGNVVVSIDYYKRILAALKSIVGGEIGSYQTLLTRARREAVLRMAEQAHSNGANYVACVRLETASVFQNEQGVGSLEVYAYGTALKTDN